MFLIAIRARRIFYGKFKRAEHTERLRACYFVEKVRAYEQLRGAVGQFPYGVFFPNFFKKRLFHNCCCVLKYSPYRAKCGADSPVVRLIAAFYRRENPPIVGRVLPRSAEIPPVKFGSDVIARRSVCISPPTSRRGLRSSRRSARLRGRRVRR